MEEQAKKQQKEAYLVERSYAGERSAREVAAALIRAHR